MTKDLIKAARKNRNYYLVEKKIDNDALSWFRYIKTMDVYAEPVLISPAMAKELLDSNKAFDLRKVGKVGKTVVISFSGKLLDGQSSLKAILLNKKSAIVFVSFNVSDKLSSLFG